MTSGGEGQGRIIRSLLVRGLEKVRVQLSVGFEREEGCTLSARNINAPLQTARSMAINRFLHFVSYKIPGPNVSSSWSDKAKVVP